MLSQVPRFFVGWPPVSPAGLLQKQERMLEDAFVGQFEVNTVFGNLEIRYAAQGREEVFLGVRIVNGPHWLADTVRACSVSRGKLHARHTEFCFRHILPVTNRIAAEAVPEAINEIARTGAVSLAPADSG